MTPIAVDLARDDLRRLREALRTSPLCGEPTAMRAIQHITDLVDELDALRAIARANDQESPSP